MAELPPRYPSSPLTNESLKTDQNRKEKKGKEKNNAEIYARCRRSSIPPCIWAGTSRLQAPPGSPPPLDHIRLWKTAQRSARVGICPLSSPSPFPPLSTVLSAGLSTSCSGGRRVPASGPPSCLHRRTTSICRPHDGRTVLGRLQWVHARTLVCRTWRPAISHLSLG